MKLSFKYFVVGIRPEAQEIKSILEQTYTRECVVISFDGKKEFISEEQYSSQKSKMMMRRPLSLGEIGCAMGHLLAYQNANDADWIIVLEDDVKIYKDPQFLENELSKLSTVSTVVHLNDIDKATNGKNRGVYPWNRRPFRTHAYAVNRAAIVKILRYQHSIITTADWPIQWESLVRFRWLNEGTFELSDMGSLIDEQRNPLQIIQHNDFQSYRSKYAIFKRIERLPLGKYCVGIGYVFERFILYFNNLELPILPRLRTALARAQSDIL